MKARQFIAELKTRGVYQVAALYCAGAWALLQVADLFFPMLGLPDSSVTMVLLAAIAGFPIALLLSWWFDLTPEGVVSAPSSGEPGRRVTLSVPHLLELGLILALVVSVGYLYIERLTPGQSAPVPAGVTSADPGRPSVAVMPFLTLSSSEEMRYLGDGLAEEILNLLSRLNELNVAARTSSFLFRNQEADLREIAGKLGVGHILEGSVRHDGEHIRVTAQLVEASSGFQVWSAAYDRDMGGLLELQEDIARKVVESLQLVLSEQSSDLLSREQETVEPVAYDYYLRGRDYLRRQRDESNLETAISFFRRALEVDGRFADAWAGLCDGLLGLYEISHRSAVFDEGEAACQRALEMDGEAVSVHVALGNLYRVSGRHTRALQAFDAALALNPSAVDAFRGRGSTHASLKNLDAAERDLQRAIDLQPTYWAAQNDLAALYFESGQFQRAIPLFQNVASLNPGSETAFNNLGSAFYMIGRPEQAAEAWQRSVALAPTAISLSNLGGSLFFAGQYEEAALKYEQAVTLSPQSYEYWGYLGEALQFVPGQQKKSSEAFARAIELGRARLAINDGDPLARAMVASYLARTGDRAAAAQYLKDNREQAERSMHELYDRAVAFTALGERERAMAALENAVKAGYPPRLLSLDRNFSELRPLPQFAALASEPEPLPDAPPMEVDNEKH